MLRFLALAVLVALPAAAQEFPAPGTGLLSWQRVGDRPLKIEGFDFTDAGTLVALSDSVLYLTGAPLPPPERTWQARARAFTREVVFVVGASEDTLMTSDGGGMERWTDGGYTRLPVRGLNGETYFGGPFEPSGFVELPPDHPHAGRLLAGGGFFYSDDRGAIWAEATRDCPSCGAHAFAVLPSGRILAAGGWGVAASDDGGASYAVTPLWGENRYLLYSITALATPGSVQSGSPACGLADAAACEGAVALGYDSTLPHFQLWTTRDGGRSWSPPQALPEPDDGISARIDILTLGSEPDGLGRALIVGGRGIVRRTLDGGQTWEVIGRLPLRESSISHRPEFTRLGPDGHVWVAMKINGPGREWMLRSVEPLAAAFAVGGEAAPAPGAPRLDVAPNPSGGRVAVRLALPSPASSAHVAVLDALGRRVAVLHEGPLGGGGHALGFDAAALAPGVYVVRVLVTPSAGEAWSETRRVTVAR